MTTPTPTQPAPDAPEALRLAEKLERYGALHHELAAATELRRLHALVTAALTVEESIAALKIALRDSKGWAQSYSDALIRDAIDRVPGAVPDGWKLVPIEPTPEMLSAGGYEETATTDSYRGEVSVYIGDDVARKVYRSMLDAVPTTEQAGAEKCPSCRNGDLYACTCPFPTSRNCATFAAPGGEAPAEWDAGRLPGEFKTGEHIVCMTARNAQFLTEGATYRAGAMNEGDVFLVNDKGESAEYLASRFVAAQIQKGAA